MRNCAEQYTLQTCVLLNKFPGVRRKDIDAATPVNSNLQAAD